MEEVLSQTSYTEQLKAVWEKAVALYQKGGQDASVFFDPSETAFLDSIGTSAQEVFDFAEDWVTGQDPDFLTFALITDCRRNYFLIQQKSERSNKIVDTGDLPPKDEQVWGVEWLPRIIPKAKAKLRGEMSSNLMFCCGGDRNFFRKHGIAPSTFLQVVVAFEKDDDAIVDWVLKHSIAVNPG